MRIGITLAGRDALGKLALIIPNLVIRKLYVEQPQESLLPDYADQKQRQRVAERFYGTGNLGPLCDFIEPDLENGAIRLQICRCEIVQRSAETPQCGAGRHPRSVVMA